MENTRATHDGMVQNAPNMRPFVMTRASYAGGQRYAATWTGDNSSTWNHMRMTTPMIENLGLSGLRDGRRGRWRIRGYAAAGPADQVAGDWGHSNPLIATTQAREPPTRSRGVSGVAQRISAAATLKIATG